MTFYNDSGNLKTGPCYIINRPVGDSCPPTCYFLDNGCYRQKTEKRFVHARKHAMQNMSVTKKQLVGMIDGAIKDNKPIRIHEGGDFVRQNSRGKSVLDKRYVKAWELALKSYSHDIRPYIWVYTHVYDKRLAALSKLGVAVYASVHTEADILSAQKAGFKLFAMGTDLKRKRNADNRDKPKYVELPIVGRTLVCPEQRLGHDRVTCVTCQWCVRGKGNIAFLQH